MPCSWHIKTTVVVITSFQLVNSHVKLITSGKLRFFSKLQHKQMWELNIFQRPLIVIKPYLMDITLYCQCRIMWTPTPTTSAMTQLHMLCTSWESWNNAQTLPSWQNNIFSPCAVKAASSCDMWRSKTFLLTLKHFQTHAAATNVCRASNHISPLTLCANTFLDALRGRSEHTTEMKESQVTW